MWYHDHACPGHAPFFTMAKDRGMEDQSYKVILEGTLRDGLERPQAVKKLSALLKRDVEEVANLLSGEPTVMAQGLDYRTALRYQSLLGTAGALSRIESDATVASEMPAAAEQTLVEQPEAHSIDPNVCPKCGYEPTGEDDVLLVRGDCPRCGLKVVNDVPDEPERVVPSLYEDSLSDRPRTPTIYGDRTPASWKRRALASIHTFSLFLAVYCCLAMLFIFSFVPLASVPGSAGKAFLYAAFISFPIFLPSLTIILISFILPIFNQGLTWGQKKAGIVVLYTEEAQLSGLYLSLAFRVVAIGLVSFAPGLIILWLGSTFGFVANEATSSAVMVLLAILGWIGSWVYLVKNPEMRGILDRAAGTIQTEEVPLPEDELKRVLMPIGIVAGTSILLGIIIPLSLRALR
jgi:hypothetical protein